MVESDTGISARANSPAATVVVPSYNRPKQLEDCLEALTGMEGIDFEIVVVDDGSPEPLAPICERFGPRVTCIRQKNSGPAKARNRGAAEASGAFVAFTDDDCRPRKEWLATLVAAHDRRDDVLVGGHVENGLPGDPFATASQDLCDFLYEHFGAASGDLPFFTSNNIGLSRDAFLRMGGFDETFPLAAAEDRDFGLRWREHGGRMIYETKAVIDHFHGMTLKKFWRQHSNYGRGAFHLHRVLDDRKSAQVKREPWTFYAMLVLHPLRRRGLGGLYHMALMVLTQFAMVRGYMLARRETRRAEADRKAFSQHAPASRPSSDT